MTYAVVFTPEAQEQLADLYRYIKDTVDAERGRDYDTLLQSDADEQST